jgi:lipopolysaccharide/colanic/teichoic acid biosynthesis glycosyltransferase
VSKVILHEPPKLEASYHIPKRENPDWKRMLDLCLVVLITPLLAPLIGAVVIYIKLVSPGPILFVQSRVGYGGDDFRIYKFRTMHVSNICRDEAHRDYVARHAGINTPVKKPDYKSDLVPGGEWLRKLSIDELPQLVNVWQGTMSLVGPRPDVLRLEDYEAWQLRRFEVLPGMTGLWQVSGKNRLTFDQMVELDIKYAETRSLSQDLLIMARTVIVLLLERNE